MESQAVMSQEQEFTSQIASAKKFFSETSAKEVTFKLPLQIEGFSLFIRLYPDGTACVFDTFEDEYIPAETEPLFTLIEVEEGYFSVACDEAWHLLWGDKFMPSQLIEKLEYFVKVIQVYALNSSFKEFFDSHVL